MRISFHLLLVAVAAASLCAGCATYDYPDAATDIQPTSDSEIGDEIVNRLREDSLAGALVFGVDVRNGIATVQGNVPSEEMRVRVIAIARGAPGVRDVVDRLFVTNRAARR